MIHLIYEVKLVMNKIIYICEDSIEGIFTAVYDAYSAVLKHETTHENIEIIAGEIENYSMFCEYKNVDTSKEKALKVSKTVCDKMGYRTYESLFYASTCDDAKKATSIYMTIVQAFMLRDSYKIMDLWTNDNVQHVLELYRKAKNEFERWREFLQFRELANGVLYSCIGPDCDILPLLAPHFENRLPNENFMIHDEIRDYFLVHEKGKKTVIVSGEYFNSNRNVFKEYSENDIIICELFREFTKTIAIKERTNLKLQQQLMPLRIQNYKIEF